jgi:catechol 2,3-dioxygenase-like lactoylglutathione lyase family enzyme
MVVRPLRIDHVALPVRDAQATLAFYRDVMKLPLVQATTGDDWGGRPWLMMIFALGEGRQLALTALRARPGDPPPGDPPSYPNDIRHLAFSADNDEELERWRQWLEKNDIAMTEEDHGSQRSLYFSDPNGAILEITAPPSDGDITADTRAAAMVDAWTRAAR